MLINSCEKCLHSIASFHKNPWDKDEMAPFHAQNITEYPKSNKDILKCDKKT